MNSLVNVICAYCKLTRQYKVGEEHPDHKIRLLIYTDPPQDLYFCNDLCLINYSKKIFPTKFMGRKEKTQKQLTSIINI